MFSIAVAGDTIINRSIAHLQDENILHMFRLFQDADLGIANCETLFHDYAGDGVFPAVEAGWSYMRSSPQIAKELRSLGFRLMGTANNHTLDYSYGAMLQTHAELTAAGIEHAGSGPDLGAARSPAYVDTATRRVAMVSMTTSSTIWSRAGLPRDGIAGRPGVNPLGYHFSADKKTLETLMETFTRFGMWVAKISDTEWQVNPPGLHHTVTRYLQSDGPGARMVLDESDVQGNLRAIENAKARSDLVVVHIHHHEWDQARGLGYAAPFLPPFARAALDAGGDIVLAQGSHAPMRGIEIYKGKPIFYDPGDFFAMSNTVARLPHDFYVRHQAGLKLPIHEAIAKDAYAARVMYMEQTTNPPRGYFANTARCGFAPVLRYDDKNKLRRLELHPFVHNHAHIGHGGVPFRPATEAARQIVNDIIALSDPLPAECRFEKGHGVIEL
jgi:poly-gamma-glutamate capsule biosynthesis protein CapA/YwtB (metallophosphatase superfamily)